MSTSTSIPFARRGLLLIALLSVSVSSGGLPARAITFGPMFHWNFGGIKERFSWGWEAAYWQTYGNPPSGNPHLHGFDVGIEFQSKTTRVYGEYQQGEIIYGLACGPVIEFEGSGIKYGIQGGAWAALMGGVDLRGRYILDQGAVFAPGAFVKIPIDLNHGDYGMSGN